MNIDCNTCTNLNITEQEQTDKKEWHKCKKYNSQLLHLCHSKDHNPKLYPCTECKQDGYEHFNRR